MLESTMLMDLLSLPFQVDANTVADTAQAVADTAAAVAETAAAAPATEVAAPPKSIVRSLVDLYIKGGAFMHILLVLSIVALAASFVKFITLMMARTSSKKFVLEVSRILQDKGIDAALDLCQKKRGPVAAILAAGLERVSYGPAAVERAVEHAGQMEMAFLEKGLPILTTTVTVAPMVGFLGTVSGMINAFEAIALHGEIEPTIVASGISEALITTASGLIVAIPFQIIYSFFVGLIDGMVLDMEESSETLLMTLTELNTSKEG